MSEEKETKEMVWRHSGFTKTGWTTEKERQNGSFFRSKLREYFFEFSDIPSGEAVDYTQKQIAEWLDAKDVRYQTPSKEKIIIFSEKLKVGIGITFNYDKNPGKIHYNLVHLNLVEDEEEE